MRLISNTIKGQFFERTAVLSNDTNEFSIHLEIKVKRKHRTTIRLTKNQVSVALLYLVSRQRPLK